MPNLKVICLTVLLTLSGTLLHADIVYDESIDGDLSNFENAPTNLDFGGGVSQLRGTIGGSFNPNVGDGYDSLTFSIAANQTLYTILLNDYQVAGGNFSTGVNIFTASGTFLGSVAMNQSHIGSDILDLTGVGDLGPGDYQINFREFTAPGQTYDFSVFVAIPEPDQIIVLILLLASAAICCSRRRISARRVN